MLIHTYVHTYSAYILLHVHSCVHTYLCTYVIWSTYVQYVHYVVAHTAVGCMLSLSLSLCYPQLFQTDINIIVWEYVNESYHFLGEVRVCLVCSVQMDMYRMESHHFSYICTCTHVRILSCQISNDTCIQFG